MCEAILVAERKKAKSKSGIYPRLPRRSVEIVKRSVPHLERGIGTNKVTIRIAMCGISKTWRQDHPDEFKKYAHLINMRESVKPDITGFLAQHPVSSTSADEENEYDSNIGDGMVKLEGDQLDEEDANRFTLDYDGDEESGAILELGYGAMDIVGEPEAPKPVESLDIDDIGISFPDTSKMHTDNTF